MIFNSIDFALFLPLVFAVYWITIYKKHHFDYLFNENLKPQNIVIVIASYLFYGLWDWRFLSLIVLSTVIDFIVGLNLSYKENKKTRKLLLFVSIVFNLGILGFFKYSNFFIDNFIQTFSFFGKEIPPYSLNIILPIGISFYTFQTMSYTIDVYRRKINPTKDFIAFSAFVAFFPQLVAGPIERASNLLPQFYDDHKFDYKTAMDGMRQILWGLFKKIVIADQCARYANTIFSHSYCYSGSTLVIGAIFFAFQIYGDFSGYSDIAIGTSRLFGFNLKQNFAYPYFSRDIAEFWRRWHISLSVWFRDYLYIPLGGNKGPIYKKIINVFIIFIVSGFWHGANWTFIVWGTLNALYFLPLLLLNTNRNNTGSITKGKIFPSLKDFFMILITFCLTTFAWIFFRAENISHAWSYIRTIFSPSLFVTPDFFEIKKSLFTTALILVLLVIEWIGREEQFALSKLGLKANWLLRYGMYFSILTLTYLFFGSNQEFIYFQF